jgi:hypothetical protein
LYINQFKSLVDSTYLSTDNSFHNAAMDTSNRRKQHRLSLYSCPTVGYLHMTEDGVAAAPICRPEEAVQQQFVLRLPYALFSVS